MYPMSTEVTETCYHTELTGWMDDVAQISEKSLHKSVNDQLLWLVCIQIMQNHEPSAWSAWELQKLWESAANGVF